jgi:hypothetical protein
MNNMKGKIMTKALSFYLALLLFLDRCSFSRIFQDILNSPLFLAYYSSNFVFTHFWKINRFYGNK